MLPDLAPTSWPSFISCAVALAGLLLRLVGKPRARDHFVVAAMLFVVLASGVGAVESVRRIRAAEHLGARILVVLGNREKTFEELLAQTGFPEHAPFAAAMEHLAAQGRIDSRLEDVDLQHRTVPLRVWFAQVR